jgi:hypothetical protein
MGTSCDIYLPNDVRVDDLITAIGFLLGAKREKWDFERGGYAYHCNFEEVTNQLGKKAKYIFPESTYDLQFHIINIAPTSIDKEIHSGSLFTNPCESHLGYILLIGGATKFWQMLGTELVKFFGGYVDYNDCDSIDKDVEFPKPRRINCHEENKEWDEFHDTLFALPTIAKFTKEFDKERYNG